MASQCSALYLSDESRCEETATSTNGLFCPFHQKQAFGLYKGYKLRNARLDSLAESAPSFFSAGSTALANQTFVDVKSEATLRELHSYLATKHALLDRVIRARKIHHSRFFSMNMDYGHEKYLDHLHNQKFIAAQALERLERRIAEVLFKKQNWFEWVRGCQDTEEAQRENEKKKIKREAALFKKHWSQFKLRMKELRMKEDMKRQNTYLDEAYNERMSLDEEDIKWDPIDDVVEDERDSYVDMIKLFLMITEEVTDRAEIKDGEEIMDIALDAAPSSEVIPKSSNKRRKKKDAGQVQNEKSFLETRSEMRKRLKDGVEYSHTGKMMLVGTIENPVRTNKTMTLPDDEMENPGLQEVRDACADLIRVEENDEDDRDAIDTKMAHDHEEGKKEAGGWRAIPTRHRPGDLPKVWNSKFGKKKQKQDKQRQDFLDKGAGGAVGKFIDLGVFDDEAEMSGKKMRVKVCGKTIYNYPSEKAMTRGGWLHFCLIAKDSNLFEAVKLCRHWDEFFELNILAVYRFFPAANWLEWVGDRMRQQLLLMGFIPYHEFEEANTTTVHHQSGSRGHIPRAHAMREARNFIAAHIKRNDHASRRFVRYLSMQTQRILVLVRDAKTGRILISPPEEELWLLREKSGMGRATKNQWNVIKKVGPKFFEEMEAKRKWHLGFTEYFDIIVWDLEAGEPFHNVYNTVSEMLFKAHRVRELKDTYNVAAPILRTITQDRDSMRVREIRAGEEVESMYDVVNHPGTTHSMVSRERKPIPGVPTEAKLQEIGRGLLYGATDALEDEILFPEEAAEGGGIEIKTELNLLDRLRAQGPDLNRFIHDLDSDEDVPEECIDHHPDHTCGHEGSDDKKDSDGQEEEDDEEEEDDDDDDWERDEGDFESILDLQKEITKLNDEEKMALGFHAQPSEPRDPNEDMEGQYLRFLKRESSKVFKECWHKADLEPGGQQKYLDAIDLIDKMDQVHRNKYPVSFAYPLALLKMSPQKHRRVIPDMQRAYAMMVLFFPSACERLDINFLAELKEHGIVNQVERAKNLPNRKKHNSNTTMPKEFFKEWDAYAKREELHADNHCLPEEWDRTIRPILARLYREGIIRNAHMSITPGRAFASKEPGRDLDLYVDFRCVMGDIRMQSYVKEPPSKEALLSTAHKYARDNPGARFAALRLWSAPHFYPLMIGPTTQCNVAFTDGQGRAWEWKFIPKDMPYSEWSVHHQATLRIEPFKRVFGRNVFIKSDLILVMGTDENNLLTLAAAATYAIQTDPWRAEVDLWRSYVNVDFCFLENLHDVWLA